MDILDGPERLLPHLELASDIELLKASLQALVQSLWVAQVRAVAVISVVTVPAWCERMGTSPAEAPGCLP